MKIGILVISLWTLVILGLLVSPLPNLTPSPYTTGFYYWDKVAHFGLFGLTGVMVTYGALFLRSIAARSVFALGYGLMLALATEGIQHFTSYREATFCDLLADVAGLSAAITLSTASYLMWVQRTRRPS